MKRTHKELLEQLQINEKLLQTVVEQMPCGVIVAEAPSGRLLQSNGQVERIFRYPFSPASTLRECSHWQGFHPDGRPYEAEAWPLSRSMTTGETISQEQIRILRGDGSDGLLQVSSVPIHSRDGGIVAVAAIYYDVTSELQQAERQRAQLLARERAARQEAERTADRLLRLQTITARLAQALTLHDVADVILEQALDALGAQVGAIALLDDSRAAMRLLRMHGYPAEVAEQFQSFSIDASIPLAEAVREMRAIVLSTPEARRAAHPHLEAIRQETGIGSVVALPLIAQEQALGALAISFADFREFSRADLDFIAAVTEQCAQALDRARLYEAERRAREEAETAVEMRDRFFSIAAHELKTPVTSLLGYSQLLQRRLTRVQQLQQSDRRAVESLTQQSMRLQRLVDVMLDTSRIQSGRLKLSPQALNLSTLAARLVAEVQPIFETHTLEVQDAQPPPIAWGDSLRIEQALYNLIHNAVKYSAADSTIRIRLAHAGQEVCITVEDEGIGIPPEAVQRIFSLFYRADNIDPREVAGIGMGLYVVREVINLHHGRVEVESSEGQGSAFHIYLPAASEPSV